MIYSDISYIFSSIKIFTFSLLLDTKSFPNILILSSLFILYIIDISSLFFCSSIIFLDMSFDNLELSLIFLYKSIILFILLLISLLLFIFFNFSYNILFP